MVYKMIKKFLVVVAAIGACVWLGFFIKSYNSNTTFNAQQRFKRIMDTVDEKTHALLKQADEQKKKAFQMVKEKEDNILRQQQKELFDQY